MEKIKRSLAILICFVVLTGSFTFAVFAQKVSGNGGENVTWSYDTITKELVISGQGPMRDFFRDYSEWKKYQYEVKSVVIESGVTRIGDEAFFQFYKLEKVSIPDTVTEIGMGAFCGCWSLTDVEIGDNVRLIDYYAFHSCESLKSVKIGSGVSEIVENVFAFCEKLESITVDEDNLYYKSDGNCLIECASNTLITGCKTSVIPSDGSIKIIGDHAFHSVPITDIVIPDGVVYIEGSAFRYSDLVSVTLPDSLVRIYNEAFAYIDSLSMVNFVGSESEWKQIIIEGDNRSLSEAKVNYNFCLHSWGEGKITQEATHTENGTLTYSCDKCSDIMNEQIPKLEEHTFGEWKELDADSHERRCECLITERAEHKWDEGIAQNGSTRYTCGYCGAIKMAELASDTDGSADESGVATLEASASVEAFENGNENGEQDENGCSGSVYIGFYTALFIAGISAAVTSKRKKE